jgi:bifunctional DNA primase/polymerase-like protein/primase-like protein
VDAGYHATEHKALTRSPTLKAALRYARRRIPVFPLRGKEPLTPHGFKDATTDPRRIHMWWNRHLSANIGVPTGSASGVAVVDLDGDSPDALHIWNGLPPTLEGKTSRGRHRYYRVESGTKVKGRKLATDLDLKGDGGYIVAPPSVHPSGTRYEFVEATKAIGMATLPDELLEPAPQQDQGPRSEARREGPTISLDNGGPIPEGTRNVTLTGIGGKKRAQGLGDEDLLHHLLATNEARCTPPLGEDEVQRIAISISRYPAGTASPEPDAETMEVLDAIQRTMWDTAWPRVGGKTERDIVVALLNIAQRHSRRTHDGGVEISVSYRGLALAAAASRRATDNAVGRLMRKGWLRQGRKGSGTRSGTLVLLPSAKVGHSNHRGGYIEETGCSGLPLRAPRLRWSSTTRERVGDAWETFVILRLGKTAGAVVDALSQKADGRLTTDEIGDILHVSRLRDMRRRVIGRLEERGIVTVSGDTVALVDDWMEALVREREASGEVEATRRDIERYSRQRDSYRNRRKVKADPTPSPATRTVKELERMPRGPDPALVNALREFLRCNPHRRGESPSWLGVALWAEELVEGKPVPAAIELALAEVEVAS